MSGSSRISLHDCVVEVSMPLPSALSAASAAAPSPAQTPEEATLLAAENRPRERIEAYVGDTLFLVVTITGPAGSICTTDTLYQALDSFGDVQVFMGRNRASARSCRLPVLRESAWIGTAPTPVKSKALSPPPLAVLSKGVWALVRTPPEHPELGDVMSVAGKQEIIVVLREKSVSHGLRNSPVWATIDRASRLFGKSLALTASKPLLVDLPLEISSHQIRVGDCSEKSFVCITARNATSDARLSIVPPYINVNSSKVVEDPDVNPRSLRSSSSAGDTDGKSAGDGGFEIPLDERYEFVPMFAVDEEDDSSDTDSDTPPDLSRGKSTGSFSNEDYGLFIPSFNHWLKRAVSLGPREAFNFVFKVVQKGDSQHKAVNDDTSPKTADNCSFVRRRSSSLILNPVRKLKPGKCLETSVAVAWNCTLVESSDDVAGFRPESAETLQREMSSGGVLATGKRGNVAVRITSVYWRPPALLDGIIVTFAGPPVATMGAQLSITVSVLNQTGDDLHQAAVLVQQEGGKVPDLLALRTEISVGLIAAGSETSLQLPCLALRAGTLALGPVHVVDRSTSCTSLHVWRSDATFQVFVVDPTARIPGDPEPQTQSSISDESHEGLVVR